MSLTFWGSLHSFIYRCLRLLCITLPAWLNVVKTYFRCSLATMLDSTHTKENSLWNLEVKSNLFVFLALTYKMVTMLSFLRIQAIS